MHDQISEQLVQGSAEHWAPGCVSMWWKNHIPSTTCRQENTILSFTQLRACLLSELCSLPDLLVHIRWDHMNYSDHSTSSQHFSHSTICQPPTCCRVLVTIRENQRLVNIHPTQHLVNIHPTQHLTNFLPTYCFQVRADNFNILPTLNLCTESLLQSTCSQHNPHIASIDSPQAK